MKRIAIALLCLLTVASSRAATVAETLDQYLSRMEKFGFSGSVTVTRKGETLFNRAYGFADRGKQVRNTPDTIFDTGSLFKQFTGAAILKLEEAGKLKTGDPMAKYLEGVPEDKREITIHQLATMTAGIAAWGSTEGVAATREARVQQILATPLVFKPGSGHGYSNAGFTLLAAIVEKVSGTTFEAYIRKTLFEPAGLRSSAYLFERPLPVPAERVAKLYAGGEESGSPLHDGVPTWFFKGAGGALTTTADLCRWHAALQSGRILSPASAVKYVTPPRGENGFAYGHATFPTPFGRMVEMGGGTTMGTGAKLMQFPASDVCIAMTINSDGEAVNEPVSEALMAIVFGGKVSMPPNVVERMVERPGRELQKLAGRYLLGEAPVDVTASEGRLRLSAASPAALAMLFGASEGGDALRTKTDPILTAQIAGDYKPLHAARIDPLPLARVETNQTRMWTNWRNELGAVKSHEFLGITPEPQGDSAANYRVDFEKGSLWLQYVWFPRGLDGVRVLREAPGIELVPSDGGSFVAVDFAARSFVVARLKDNALTIERVPMVGQRPEP